MKKFLNILHFIYCAFYSVTIDTPLLFNWEIQWTILFYILTLPLFIWGLIRMWRYDP